jgi:two-component system NarL family response regulator
MPAVSEGRRWEQMPEIKSHCALLADRHPGLTEGIRGLLESRFETVVIVADPHSLLTSARRLQPDVALVDLSLTRSTNLEWLADLHDQCPDVKVVVLSVHDAPGVRRAVMAAGASGFVPKAAIVAELLPTLEALLEPAH